METIKAFLQTPLFLLKRLSLFLSLSLSLSLNLYSQDFQILSLENAEMAFPFQAQPHIIVVSGRSIYPSESGITKGSKQEFQFEVPLYYIFPNDKYLFYGGFPWNHTWHVNLSVDDRKNLMLTADQDNDGIISSAEKWPATVSKPIYVKAQFTDDSTSWQPSVPIEIRVEAKNNSYELKVTSLQAFQLDTLVDDRRFETTFYISNWSINFNTRSLNTGNGQVEDQNFLLREPFEVDGRWYYYANLNVKKATIELHQVEEFPVRGFRTGYHVSLETLQQLSGSCTLKRNKYSLLHFWGPWCHPCIEEMPEFETLAVALSGSGMVNVISYSLFLRENDAEKFESLMTAYPASGCHQIIRRQRYAEMKKDGIDDTIDLLHILEYPTYLLLDPAGKIIFRGNQQDGALMEILKKCSLL